ncbi:hypothetical protein Skr01_46680 [Sphaerisporangium krabiense]|nr:hypothetical protein Skr01_46680 [Sphaerisporangium krabiense]
MAPTMCNTTGRGTAKNRAFSGVTAAPPISPSSRTAPMMTGTADSRISPAGTRHCPRSRAAPARAPFPPPADGDAPVRPALPPPADGNAPVRAASPPSANGNAPARVASPPPAGQSSPVSRAAGLPSPAFWDEEALVPALRRMPEFRALIPVPREVSCPAVVVTPVLSFVMLRS